jgi:aminoglycoside phosphotransferase (APT) family kinase protein
MVSVNTPLELSIIGKVLSRMHGLSFESFGVTSQNEEWIYLTLKETGKGTLWVLRFPKDIYRDVHPEYNLLKRLAMESKTDVLQFDVPNPKQLIETEIGQALLYQHSKGIPLDPLHVRESSALAVSIGKSIGSLHEINVSFVADTGIVRETNQDIHRQISDELAQVEQSGHVSERLISRYRNFLGYEDVWDFQPTFIHNEFRSEDLFVVGEEISAISNFFGAKIGDPALDLSQILGFLTPEAGRTVLDAYKIRRGSFDANIERRIKFYSEFTLLRYLLYGLDIGDKTVTDDAIEMIVQMEESIFVGV